MKQSSMAVIGVIAVIVIAAIVVLALSGQKNNSSSVTTSVSGYSYTTIATTVASNATRNTTSVVNSTTTVTTSVNQSNATTKKYNLMVGSSSAIGNYLENSAGYTLYLLNSDTPYKTSTCTSTCTTYWPPYMFSGNLSAFSVQSGINASALGVINRTGGGTQLTYYGWPLYLFSGDSSAGQVNGNGVKAFGGTWYAITVPKPTSS